MKTLKEHLQSLQKIKRRSRHPLVHEIHKKYRISKKTLFYIKEYGPHTHIAKTIIRESLKILLFASIVSSFGGLALEHVKSIFVYIIPLTILLPTLNDMIGDYGTVISSRFSTLLHEGKIETPDFKNPELRLLIIQVLITSIITGTISASLALVISLFSKLAITGILVTKIYLITAIDVIILVNLLAVTSVYAGLYFYKKSEDPNNFLIPITTSVADFGNMIILALLIRLFF